MSHMNDFYLGRAAAHLPDGATGGVDRMIFGTKGVGSKGGRLAVSGRTEYFDMMIRNLEVAYLIDFFRGGSHAERPGGRRPPLHFLCAPCALSWLPVS